MTAYKRPVFFDRDIKSFSELSADSGLDLGIVARSILADSYLQVGTTGSDGTVSVKDASDAERIKLDGYWGHAVFSSASQYYGTRLSDSALTFWSDNNSIEVANYNSVSLTLGNDFGQTRVLLTNLAEFYLGGSGADGYVAVKNNTGSEAIRLNAVDRVASLTNAANAQTISLSGATATATFGGPVAGTVSVKNASNAATIALNGATGSITLSGAASKITGLVLSEITGGTDAASKAYVDSIAQGLNIKGACHVSSQGNIEVLATTTEVDGHTLSEGERVLVRYQSDAIENGIYRFNGTGLERTADMAVGSHAAGAFTFVQFGTNADQGWVCTADAPADVVGTDALPWTQFSAAGVIEAGDGLQLIGTVMSAKLDGTTLSASAAGLKVLGLPEMFEIGGLATSADVSAENLNTLTAGRASNAVGLHSHSADYTFLAAASGLAAGQAAIVSASYEAAPAGTTSSGAYVVGVVENVDAGQARIVRAGFCSAVLSGATPGDTYYVQADGTLGTALPTSGRVVFVGVAVSELDLFVQIRDFGSILA